MEKGEEVIISRRWGDFMRGVIGAVGAMVLAAFNGDNSIEEYTNELPMVGMQGYSISD